MFVSYHLSKSTLKITCMHTNHDKPAVTMALVLAGQVYHIHACRTNKAPTLYFALLIKYEEIQGSLAFYYSVDT